jgi:hypothetical protein
VVVAYIHEREEDVRKTFGAGYTWDIVGVSFRAYGSLSLDPRGWPARSL